jgi:hypothetical protein
MLFAMNRLLIVLITSFVLICSSQGYADSFSFGLSLQSGSEVRFFPLLHAHFGYDFGSASDGPSLEASLFTVLIINRIAAQAFYRMPVLEDGSNVYGGAGAAFYYFTGLVDAGSASSWGAFGVIGWESPLTKDYTYFLEVAPGAQFTPTGSGFSIRLIAGLRAHR